MEEYFRVGSFVSTHGVRGEFKVFPTTDDPGRFKKIKEVILDNGKEKKTVRIEGAKFFKNMVILKVEGIDDMDQAALLRGTDLYVTRKNAIPLSKGEYYIADLIGLEVEDEAGLSLGKVSDVLQTGANDVYVVTMENEKELLLPAIKQCILNIDIENQKMRVHIMDGLLDL